MLITILRLIKSNKHYAVSFVWKQKVSGLYILDKKPISVYNVYNSHISA